MSGEDTDDVGRAVLYALQEDTRNMSSGDAVKRMGTLDSTVYKHIQWLESEGVAKRYSAGADYQKSGYPLRMLLHCTASVPRRGELAPEILKMDGVMAIQELVTGEQNLLVTVVCEMDDDITAIVQELLGMGVTVADEALVHTRETASSGESDAERRAENDP